MRQQALLQPDDEDDGELQPLRGVERDQRDGVHLLVVLVGVGHEGDLFEERRQGGLGRQLVVLGGDGAQLLDVVPAVFAVSRTRDSRYWR